VPRRANVQAQSNRISPGNRYYLPSLDVIRNKLQLRRVTLDIDIVIAYAEATVTQLLALYMKSQLEPVPTTG
jgi:hypothetical protein